MNPNKSQGHDGVSVRMLKLSCPSIIKLLLIILRMYLKFETFPDDWKKGNFVPAHKKDNKQIVNNYHSVSMLPIWSKGFEKLDFDAFFELMMENKLWSSTQGGFKPNDSSVNQLFLMSYGIFTVFNANPS